MPIEATHSINYGRRDSLIKGAKPPDAAGDDGLFDELDNSGEAGGTARKPAENKAYVPVTVTPATPVNPSRSASIKSDISGKYLVTWKDEVVILDDAALNVMLSRAFGEEGCEKYLDKMEWGVVAGEIARCFYGLEVGQTEADELGDILKKDNKVNEPVELLKKRAMTIGEAWTSTWRGNLIFWRWNQYESYKHFKKSVQHGDHSPKWGNFPPRLAVKASAGFKAALENLTKQAAPAPEKSVPKIPVPPVPPIPPEDNAESLKWDYNAD